MPRIATLPLLFLSLLPLYTFGQTLQIGGKVGANSQRPISGKSQALDNGGSAGIFAAYQAEQYKLGIKIELNYEHHENGVQSELLEVPILAQLGLDPKQRLRLLAGPYVGVGKETTGEDQVIRSQAKLRWGFTTGLEVNIPLSRKMVLISDARVSKSWQQNEAPEGKDFYLVPTKSIHFHLSLGLAYRWQQWRKKSRQEPS